MLTGVESKRCKEIFTNLVFVFKNYAPYRTDRSRTWRFAGQGSLWTTSCISDITFIYTRFDIWRRLPALAQGRVVRRGLAEFGRLFAEMIRRAVYGSPRPALPKCFLSGTTQRLPPRPSI